MTNVIDINDVWKIYDVGGEKIEALRSVSLQIRKGSFISIVGHSGSGKTTLLSILGGLTKPSRGSVRIDGTDIWNLNDRQLSAMRNRKIGFIFQFSSLIPTLRAIDNVALPVIYANGNGKTSRKETYEYAAELLSTLGLGHKLQVVPFRTVRGPAAEGLHSPRLHQQAFDHRCRRADGGSGRAERKRGHGVLLAHQRTGRDNLPARNA